MGSTTLPLFLITITLLVLLHQPFIAIASPLSPVSLFANTNTTRPAVHASPNNVQCVHSADWVTSRFRAYDCFSAIGNFQDTEVHRSVSPSALFTQLPPFIHSLTHRSPLAPCSRHSSMLYEFLSAGIRPIYPQFTQRTPRRYTYKSCTMAIVMLDDLPHGLPGMPSPPGRWTRTDMCDYVSIETAVLNVRDGCLSIVLDGEGQGRAGGGVGFVNPVGYDTVGIHGAVGVFLWDTDSTINRAVQGGVVGSGNGNLTAGASGDGGGGTKVAGTL